MNTLRIFMLSLGLVCLCACGGGEEPEDLEHGETSIEGDENPEPEDIDELDDGIPEHDDVVDENERAQSGDMQDDEMTDEEDDFEDDNMDDEMEEQDMRDTNGRSPMSSDRSNESARNDSSDEELPARVYARMRTSMGEIILELNHEKAPVSVENFLEYAESDYYDGTLIHRVVNRPINVIQGGGFTEQMQRKPTQDPIENEWQNGLANDKGTIAMARLNSPDTATSQFFINVAANNMLDEGSPRTGGVGYAVFGKVSRGMDVVEQISQVQTETITSRGRPMRNVPVEPIIIEEVSRISKEEAMQQGEEGEAMGDQSEMPDQQEENSKAQPADPMK